MASQEQIKYNQSTTTLMKLYNVYFEIVRDIFVCYAIKIKTIKILIKIFKR